MHAIFQKCCKKCEVENHVDDKVLRILRAWKVSRGFVTVERFEKEWLSVHPREDNSQASD